MTKNALILHGTNSNPNANWFPWLRNQLAWRGYDVWVPALPQPEEPNLVRYWEFLRRYSYLPGTVIVGHSSGGTAALGVLHKLPPEKRVGLVVCVAPFYRDEGWNCEGLFTEAYDWEKIRRQADRIELLWSPDDTWISEEQTNYLCEKLHIQPMVIPGSGHFNIASSERFYQLPAVADLILSY